MRIGSIGAGFLAQAFARRAIAAGHTVMLSNSRGPDTLRALHSATGAQVGTAEESAQFGEFVFVALPFSQRASLTRLPFGSAILLDAANYYPERDGSISELDARRKTTSELITELVPTARLVKAFNAILAMDLEPGASVMEGQRRALPIAGEDQAAKDMVSILHESMGFEALDTGDLKLSWRFERAKPAYCIPFDREGLINALNVAKWDEELPHGSWRRARE